MKIQTRTNLGQQPQWKKWRQIQNLLGILLKLFGKAKLKEILVTLILHEPFLRLKTQFVKDPFRSINQYYSDYCKDYKIMVKLPTTKKVH